MAARHIYPSALSRKQGHSLLKIGRDTGLTDKFRSSRFKRGGKSVNEPNPLTKEQLLTLYNHTFKEKHLELTKIRFCLQSFIGVRYSDLFRITPENIENGWLKIKPAKTKRFEVEVNQPYNTTLN